MRSTSLKLLLNAGINHPREFRDKLIHEWFLTPEELKSLNEYFLTAIPFEEFFSLIRNGEIYKGQYVYQVIWIHKIASVKKSGKAIVSFRYCELLGCGYALVKKNNIEKPLTQNLLIASQNIINREPVIPSLLKRS